MTINELKNLNPTWVPQAASNVLESFREGKNRVAVVMPTGSGKSIVMSLVISEILPEVTPGRILYLAPTNPIIDHTRENLRSLSFDQYCNLETYDSLHESIKKGNSWGYGQYNLIVTDELHRLGARTWGNSFKEVIRQFPGTKILGLTATKFRYLDGMRDISAELFDTVAFEKELIDAWREGIYPSPHYYLGFIDRVKSLNNLMETLNVTKVHKGNLPKILEDSKLMGQNYSRTNGITEIFKKAIPVGTKRVVAFAENLEHLPEVRALVDKSLREAGFVDHQFYEVHSGQKSDYNRSALDRFNHDSYSGLKVMLSVNMLSEGIHVDDCTVAILFRPTLSANVFYQQIGRVMSIGQKTRPVIIDLVNNLELSAAGIDLCGASFSQIVKNLCLGKPAGVPWVGNTSRYELDLHVEEIADYVRLEQIIHKSYCPEEVHDWLIETREGSFEWLLGENEGEPATT